MAAGGLLWFPALHGVLGAELVPVRTGLPTDRGRRWGEQPCLLHARKRHTRYATPVNWRHGLSPATVEPCQKRKALSVMLLKTP